LKPKGKEGFNNNEMEKITISEDFKKKTTAAIFSVVIFIITYMLLLVLACALTILCGYGGIMLIAFKPNFVTLMLGLGLAAMGALTLFFLVKFMFTLNKIDTSGYIEITEDEQPLIFNLINSIVKEAGTDLPKKVYISSEVNASVFYDSGFWSMFLPIRKNLHIGLGLMNAVTIDELKGIIAHEFGHFSQRSMKIGSYVYNVNYIIHNMLFNNESFDNTVRKLANLNGYIALPVAGSFKIVQGIQWVLGKVYYIVNTNYLALSREMEFHADEVAARIAGPSALITSLVRLELAGRAQGQVFDYYGSKINDNIKPSTIFPQHSFAMQLAAEDFGIPIIDGLPAMTLENKNKFNKSKLNFEDKWASHPSDNDRIKKIKSLNLIEVTANNHLAMTLLKNRDILEKQVTDKLFENINFDGEPKEDSLKDFKSDFAAKQYKYSFAAKFNNYYDDYNPTMQDIAALHPIIATGISEKELFSSEKVNLIYESIALQSDIEILGQIYQNSIFKTFEYDGKKYKASEAKTLIPELENKLATVKENIEANTTTIFSYYLGHLEQHKRDEYISLYNSNKKYTEWYNKIFPKLDFMFRSTAFLNEVTSFKIIESNFQSLVMHEKEMKEIIMEFIHDPTNSDCILADDHDTMHTYAQSNLTYFKNEAYIEENLEMFMSGLQTFNRCINTVLLNRKKMLLDFQGKILETTSV